jgi:hypothetical protein
VSHRAATKVNPEVASKQNLDPEAEPSGSGRRPHGTSRADQSDMTLRRGGRGSTVTRACRATGETVLVPSRNRWSRVGRITGNTGKTADGETVAARLGVARKWGNAHGAKGPYCIEVLANTGGRGALTKAPIHLQDLRRRLYVKAKAEPIGLITLGVNCAGARSAGNLHATCDVAGDGTQLTVRLVRHSQRKRGAPDRPDLRSMAPFLDPTTIQKIKK